MIGGGAIAAAPIAALDAQDDPRLSLAARRVYRCYLGSALIPITSIQLRLRQTDNSYVSVVVPNAPAYADDIAANQSETLRIEQGLIYSDGTEVYEELATASVDNVADQRGTNSQSITLTGYGDNATVEQKAVPLEGLNYYAHSEGTTRLRTLPEPRLKPGDTATAGGYSIVAALISIYIAIASDGSPVESMEVSD